MSFMKQTKDQYLKSPLGHNIFVTIEVLSSKCSYEPYHENYDAKIWASATNQGTVLHHPYPQRAGQSIPRSRSGWDLWTFEDADYFRAVRDGGVNDSVLVTSSLSRELYSIELPGPAKSITRLSQVRSFAIILPASISKRTVPLLNC